MKTQKQQDRKLDEENGGRMKKPEPIELENNLGPDAVTGEINRVPWMAYDVDEMDIYIAEMESRIPAWHKFSEETPEKDAWCLVYHEGEIDADHYTDECNNHCRFVMYGNLVTHWMPLPQKPEE